jgi:hypothetical protein
MKQVQNDEAVQQVHEADVRDNEADLQNDEAGV